MHLKIAIKPETHRAIGVISDLAWGGGQMPQPQFGNAESRRSERLNSIVKCIFTIEFRCPRGHHDDRNGESASNSASSLKLFLDYRVPMPARVLAFNSIDT